MHTLIFASYEKHTSENPEYKCLAEPQHMAMFAFVGQWHFLQSDTSTKEIKTKTKRTNKTKKPLLHTHTATIIEQENISTISKQIPQSYPSIGWVSIVWHFFLVWHGSDFISDFKLQCKVSQILAEKITMVFFNHDTFNL